MAEKFLVTYMQDGQPCAKFLIVQDIAMLIGMADIYDADFFRVFRIVDGAPIEIEFRVDHEHQTVDLYDARGILINFGQYLDH